MLGLITAHCALATAGMVLLGASWKRRPVLAGICSITTVAASIAATILNRNPAAHTIFDAGLIALVLGAALLALGEAISRLLEDDVSDPHNSP